MKRHHWTRKEKKIMVDLAYEDPSLSSVLPLLLYQGSPLQKLDHLAYVLNTTPHDDPAHTLTEMIEALITQTPSKKDWIEKQSKTLLGSSTFHPSPGSPLHFFNDLAKWILFYLEFVGYENKHGDIEVQAKSHPIPGPSIVSGLKGGPILPTKLLDKSVSILWLLWEIYYQKIGLDRLKRCPQCQKWFVDRTRNNKKERCSSACTWKWWSWGRRKAEGHKLPKTKIRKSLISKKRHAARE